MRTLTGHTDYVYALADQPGRGADRVGIVQRRGRDLEDGGRRAGQGIQRLARVWRAARAAYAGEMTAILASRQAARRCDRTGGLTPQLLARPT